MSSRVLMHVRTNRSMYNASPYRHTHTTHTNASHTIASDVSDVYVIIIIWQSDFCMFFMSFHLILSDFLFNFIGFEVLRI